MPRQPRIEYEGAIYHVTPFFVSWITALLLGGGWVASAQQPANVHFTVDAARDRHPISRFIYGINRPLEGPYTNLTLTRLGGNRWTAHNWVNNASNAGSDWQFQNDDYLGGGNDPGGAVSPALKNAASRNAGIVVTVPMIGYVAADKKGGGDVRKSGADYLQTRFRKSLPRKGSAFTLTPDPKSPVVYQDEFVHWLKQQAPGGLADATRPVFLDLDNEPDLWASTHAVIHPANPSYAEMVQRTVDYARAIKDVAPAAMIFGPVNYGWQGFVRLQNAPDAKDRDFQEFYLQQMAQAQRTHGKRLLDVLDVHWYPEARGGGQRIAGPETVPAVVAARVQAPRSLWDATYTEDSWITKDAIHQPIALLPRLQKKIAQHYPGTKLGMTEYNYGGGGHISGAIAQADVLGIFGREGVFAACQWPLTANENFVAAAFQMFRNFDGKNGTFGDTSVFAATDNVAHTSIYASVDSANPKRIVLVAINKTGHPIAGVFKLANLPQRSVITVHQLTGETPSPRPAGNIPLATPESFPYTLPAFSVSTLGIILP